MQTIDFVMYTSKHCNLRCRYCYELPLLSDTRRMSLESIERAFQNLNSYLRTLEEQAHIRFCWHGGEPLLIEPEYYWDIFALERKVFAGSGHYFSNSVQSNLTQLDDKRVDLIKNGFDQIGVSLVLFTGLRVGLNGKCQEHRARKHLDQLLDLGIPVNGITVLTRPNIERVEDIYRFYRDRNMSFRLLPIEPGLYGEGSGLELGAQEILSALCATADHWFQEAPSLRIEPIHATIGAVLASAQDTPATVAEYDLSKWMWVVRVDTSGEILGYNDGFEAENSSGNLFRVPFAQILGGTPQRAKAAKARQQIEASCNGCEHYMKRCNGFHVVDGAPCNHERQPDGSLRCVVAKGLLDHITMRLTQGGVLDARGRLSSAYLASVPSAEMVMPQPAVA